MTNPVLVEVTRGDFVESRHRGAYCVVDAEGAIIRQAGDIETPVFPRSSVKIMQALGLVETGAADQFGFTQEELALSCASHGGEVTHVGVAQAMLDKIEVPRDSMKCGSHWPMHEPAGRSLAMEGQTPDVLHNNCSGKHAGFLAYLKHNKIDPTGYTDVDHPLQQTIAKTMGELCEVDLSKAPVGIDGCAIPTWALPLKNLALGFSKLAVPQGRVSEARATAITRLRDAVFAAPFMVAGSDRYCTKIMTAFPNRVFVKVGAEGVFTAFVPEKGYGIAVKCDDGAFRGAEVILSALLEDLGVISKEEFMSADTPDLYEVPLLNRNGTTVGVIRPAASA